MEEKIIAKINEVVEYIISKPVDTVTLNDYTILHEELKDARFRKEQEENGDRLKQLMATAFPTAFHVPGSTVE